LIHEEAPAPLWRKCSSKSKKPEEKLSCTIRNF
jgi:hypothetical protein